MIQNGVNRPVKFVFIYHTGLLVLSVDQHLLTLNYHFLKEFLRLFRVRFASGRELRLQPVKPLKSQVSFSLGIVSLYFFLQRVYMLRAPKAWFQPCMVLCSLLASFSSRKLEAHMMLIRTKIPGHG